MAASGEGPAPFIFGAYKTITMASVDVLVCPTDCSAVLPIFAFSECNPVLLQAQISDIFLFNDGYPLTDWTNAPELISRISDDSQLANAIRQIPVIASLADPTVTEKKISHGRTVFSPQDFAISGRIDDNSDTNYDAARASGCNRSYRILFATMGGKLYGGNTGILASVRMWESIVEDDLEYAVISVNLKWRAQFMPLRIDNPLA